ncbi:MAG: polyhydroxyalkanoate synthesis regulator DNA-binding domain-containing protein [Planctomycetia bacterium]|nr:polyhydroxyalkanoate synthesis regulator DNA-binding domain-containing protein [Planctomycetia bacterium]
MREITRYANRKMYDSRTRAYITLEGVARLVVKGEEVRVTDRDTGGNLTAAVLLQAMMEQEKGRPGTFGPGALAGLLKGAAKKKGRK